MVKKIARSYPGRLILGMMAGTIALGTFLLALPFATTVDVSFIDLFFTATSATCVCSQLTVPIDYLTNFGRFVVLVLMQIGGIGLMTISIFFLSMFLDLGLTTQLMAGKLLEMEGIKKARQLLRFVIASTLLIELTA